MIEGMPDPSAMMSMNEPAQAGFFMPAEIEPPTPPALAKLQTFIDSKNIAADLTEDELRKIGQRAYSGYLVDEKSREGWLREMQDALDMANQVVKEKSFPWANAANIKLPMITDATIKFASRAYAEIIRDNKVVKGSVVGEDSDGAKAQRAERVGDYMSFQLMEREKEWEPDTDKLLHLLPLTCHMFRKRYWCPNERRTKSELRMPDNVCINQQASSLETARRVTDIIENITQNEVISNQRAGVWLDVKLRGDEAKPALDKEEVEQDDYYTFLEQCCWLDLDQDGYEEPYIVTLEKESTKVVRILANYDINGVFLNDRNEVMRILPKQIYTDYIFMPSLDGKYYGTGFGRLMYPLSAAANGIVNRLLDAGTLANVQGGYLSREIKIRGGQTRFSPGEWKRTEATAEQLARGIYPLPVKEPSPTLFNLLGLIMDLTKNLSSFSEVMNGDAMAATMQPTTVMALIEQGMKTFNAIYKRIYRSMQKEFRQLYALNYEYSDEKEYFTVLDKQKSVMRADFEPDSMDVVPVADPNSSSDMQRLARAQALKEMIGMPGVDPKPIMKMYLEALKVPEAMIAQILPEQDPNGVPPHVQALLHDVEKQQAELTHKEERLALDAEKLDLERQKFEVSALETISKAIMNFANAEAAESGQQMATYQAIANNLLEAIRLESEAKNNANQSRRLEPMGQQPSDPGSQAAY